MDSTLLKYSAKDHFFKAALCHFCVDMLNAKVSRNTELVSMYSECNMNHCPNIHPLVTQLAVQKYEEMFPAFSDSRECKLLKVGFKQTVYYNCCVGISVVSQKVPAFFNPQDAFLSMGSFSDVQH